ncbi:MAG: PIN domain-containing protein [Candidatus Omnitrophica bacterium]|nr:PIN domain-containing protein [Candidatus Omnitrophota bacterium]
MILVDTSIWIDFLTEKSHPKIDLFKKIIDNNEDVALTPYIYLEVLQGAKDDRSFQRLRDYLDVQIFRGIPRDSPGYHSTLKSNRPTLFPGCLIFEVAPSLPPVS